MIRLTVHRLHGRPIKARASGHSGYAQEGSDIVCSALSAIMQTAALGIKKVQPAAVVSMDELNADLSIALAPKDADNPRPFEDAQLLMETMLMGIEDIAAQYPKYVNVVFKTEGK